MKISLRLALIQILVLLCLQYARAVDAAGGAIVEAMPDYGAATKPHNHHLAEVGRGAVGGVLVQPYNILDAKPRPVCPKGYVLANNRCHKRAK